MFDFRAFLINVVRDNIIRVYKFEKRADGLPTNVKSAIDFPKVRISRIELASSKEIFREMKVILLPLESLARENSSCLQR